MTINKIYIYITTVIVILLIGIPTFYKVIKNNHDKLNLVTEKLVIENAEKCVYEGKCNSSTVTLKELYENNYIKKTVIDPISKTVYNKKSYVVLSTKKSTFYPEY